MVISTQRHVASTEYRIGRDATWATDVLDHPQVSRRHAIAFAAGPQWMLKDAGSANGTFVNGIRIKEPTILQPGDRVRIGALKFVFDAGRLNEEEARRQLLISATDLSVVAGQTVLLRDINVQISRGSFVCLIGPSGSGKSTLLRALCGRRPYAGGHVTFDGEDLRTAFPWVSSQIGYVPQRESFHDALKVQDVLRCTAALRLPSDSTLDDRSAAVSHALERTGLAKMADRCAGALSGGQRRRLALANELVAAPSCLFIDEVTSGLDEASDHEIMLLLSELAKSGLCVLCVTHNTRSIAQTATHIFAMRAGGTLAFAGHPDALMSALHATSMGDIYRTLSVRHEGASSAVRAERLGRDDQPAPARSAPTSPRRQCATYLLRQTLLWRADRTGVMWLGAQVLILVALLTVAFQRTDAQRVSLGFFITVCAFWFGCSNGSKELVREQGVIFAEIMSGASQLAYLVAKVGSLLVAGALQVGLLVLLLMLTVAPLQPGHTLLAALLAMTAGSLTGACISAAVETPEQSATILPLAIIPQLLLSGAVVVPLADWGTTVGKAAITTYWLNRLVLQAYGVTPDSPTPWIVLTTHLVVLGCCLQAVYWLTIRGRRR